MEKRVLLAVFLSFLVLYTYQSLVGPTDEEAARRGTPAATEATRSPGSAPAAPGAAPGAGQAGAPGAAVPQATEQAAPAEAEPLVADPAPRDIVVETELYRAVINTRGARVTSWTLKNYEDLQTGEPLELIPTDIPAEQTRPFELRTDDEAVNARLRNALFRPEGEAADGVVKVSGEPETLVFEYRDAAGLTARKEFVFAPSSYLVGFDAEVLSGDRRLNPSVLWGPGIGDLRPGGSSWEQKAQGIVMRDGDTERLDVGAIQGQRVYEAPFTAAGVDDHYFIAIALPVRPVRVEYDPVSVPVAGGEPKEYMSWGVRQAQSPEGLRFYFGPKDFNTLREVDPRLVKAINFGMLDFLAVPLLSGLNWVYGFVGNYGWSIIILTIIINIFMFPLRHKSMVSMRKMQEIQPQIKAIQERYKKYKATDPERQKMNTEMMNLYREKGANPASGCLPMLLTLPVLFAFYSLLSQAIEMRGAPFILWITDLSRHDPLYVTPILMGISQVWQQRLTPTGGDPMQQRMMMAMPIVFTFMFLWAPSGLVIYWFASNLLAIGQQYVTNRLAGPPPAAQKAAAASATPVVSPSPAPPMQPRRKARKG